MYGVLPPLHIVAVGESEGAGRDGGGGGTAQCTTSVIPSTAASLHSGLGAGADRSPDDVIGGYPLSAVC